MSEIRRPRRYYLLKRLVAEDFCDETFVEVWRAKQEAEPGTALPSDFPVLSKLSAKGYTTREDLDGADEAELASAGLKTNEARAVLAALVTL